MKYVCLIEHEMRYFYLRIHWYVRPNL